MSDLKNTLIKEKRETKILLRAMTRDTNSFSKSSALCYNFINRRFIMPSVKEDRKISEMTVGELKSVIRETVMEMLDPDYGLELREDFISKLESSISSPERIPFHTVKKKLGSS